jgi:hypothetical protein
VTSTLLGREKVISLPRSHILGLSANMHSGRFAGSTGFHIIRVAGQPKPLLVPKEGGMFDLSTDSLNSVLGYDLRTFDRCWPSEPYFPEASD